MPLPQYVERRGNRLWYRRAYPKELWPIVGKGTTFAKSLRTDSPSEATRSRPEAERAFFVAVDEARAELAKLASRPVLSREAAETLAVKWFLDALESAEDWRDAASPSALEQALEFSSDRAADARQSLAEEGAGAWTRRAAEVRERGGYASDPQADALLARLLGRAAVAAEEVEQGRLIGDYGKRPRDALFAAAMEAPHAPAPPQPVQPAAPLPAAPSQTVADLERAFRETKFPSLSPATVEGYAPVFRIIRDVLGKDTLLATITHDDGLRLFETITSLPTNAMKRDALKGLGTVEMVAEGKRLGLPTVSPKTVNDRYMASVGALFRFAVERGWMTVNPVKGMRAHDPVNDRDRRDTFGPNLPTVFGAAPWSTKDASNPLHYWGPLLALFHGLRLGEVPGCWSATLGRKAIRQCSSSATASARSKPSRRAATSPCIRCCSSWVSWRS